VGGPLDGQRKDSENPDGFNVLVREPMPNAGSYIPANSPVEMASVERVAYRVETITFPDGAAQFWVPNGQPGKQTMTMLLESYERASIAARKAARPR